jgi:hypothetical protein
MFPMKLPRAKEHTNTNCWPYLSWQKGPCGENCSFIYIRDTCIAALLVWCVRPVRILFCVRICFVTTGNNGFAVRNQETHGKGCTTDYCTVNDLCRAPSIEAHDKKGLPCVSYSTRWKKWLTAQDGDGVTGVQTAALSLLTVYFGTPNMFITLSFWFDYGTNTPLGTLII